MSDTREKIAELGEFLIRRKGYNAFSYNDISQSLGIKNAAVHYHYPTKENLGEDIIKESLSRFKTYITEADAENLNEWQKLERFLKTYVKSKSEDKVCLVGSLGPDFYTLGPSMQNELRIFVEEIHAWLTDILKTGRQKKFFYFSEEPSVKAILIITNMLGALQLVRISSNVDFEAVLKSVLDNLKG